MQQLCRQRGQGVWLKQLPSLSSCSHGRAAWSEGPGCVAQAPLSFLLQSREGCLVNMTVSYLEIYNDRMYDLLQPYKRGSNKCVRRLESGGERML